MKTQTFFLTLILCIPLFSYAGQGKDGGWPQSVQLLRIAKQNLLDLLNQSSDQDVKDALNNMHDRNESIKVEDVDLALVKSLVNKLQNPDVEQIEKSQYKGVRLFYYDDSNLNDLKIYATKNFYNLEKYQVNPGDLNASILKEVQTLILHEISHLWGFGEENGDINYARTFAIRMVNILHGSLKINFTNKEKLESLSKAYFYETSSTTQNQADKHLSGKHYYCSTFNMKGTSNSELDLEINSFSGGSDGPEFNGQDDSHLRWTLDFYLISETSHMGFGSDGIKSHYMKKKGVNRVVSEYTICHTDKKKMDNVSDRFIRPYYSRSNLLTDYDNASLVVYQSLLIQDILFLGDTFKSMNDVSIANQKQIIQNIDFKIKVQNREAYERLTGRKYKYSKPQDTEDMEKLNSVINSGLSTEGKAIWAQVVAKVAKLNDSILAMKNYSRQLQMDTFFKNFMKDFNAIAEKSNEFEDQNRYNSMSCGKHKRLGDYYSCNIETNKTTAEARIKLYEIMLVGMNSLVKRFTNRANGIKD